MEEKQPIIALGAGGSSKLVFDGGRRIERVENVKDVTNCIARIEEMIKENVRVLKGGCSFGDSINDNRKKRNS